MTVSETKRKRIAKVLGDCAGSQYQLSVRLGVTPSTVSMAISGTRKSSRYQQILLAAGEFADRLERGEEVVEYRAPRSAAPRKQRGRTKNL
jgi:predicted transcriptional regulator